jgi:hypothetical protein
MGGVRVMLDWLCYALPSLAARKFGTLSHRGREAYSSHEGQSRCAARYSFIANLPSSRVVEHEPLQAPAPTLSLTAEPS